MLTLNQIRRTFEVIADAHRQINGFGFDNEANFGQSNDLQFPCLYVVQEPSSIANGIISRPFTCFVLDRYYGDADAANSNITDVLSDTQLICTDVVSLLNNTEYVFQLDKTNIQLEPIYAVEGDLLAGYKLQVTLTEAFDFWRCSVPYDFIVIEQVNGSQITSTNEKDPTVPSYVKAITQADISNWNAAAGDVTGFVTTSQISGFITTANLTGYATTTQLNGYYPSGNPSGFVNSGIVSGYATTGQLQNYYPTANPSGFISSGQVQTLYYPNTNPSGFVNSGVVNGYATTGQLQGYYTIGNPSGFITSGQAASTYYPNSNPSGFLRSYTETDPTVPSVVKAIPVSGSAGPLLWSGSAYQIGTRSSTWAARPTGTFTGQIILITDIGVNGTMFFWNGSRWLPDGDITLIQTATASSVGSTTTKTNIVNALIPAGLLTTNSQIMIDYHWSMNNNTGFKLIEMAFNTSGAVGGTAVYSAAQQNLVQIHDQRWFKLGNSLSSNQLMTNQGTIGFYSSTGATARFSINFAVDQYFCLNMQKQTSASDTLTLESLTVKILV